MRFIEDLCSPALLYLIFLVVQLGLDMSLGLWVTFTIKLFFGIAVVAVLDTFCGVGLSVVSWFMVATPFLITALATAIAIGTNFDAIVMGQFKEPFTDSEARETDIPEASNSVSRQAVKTDKKFKRFSTL
jgi:hypothetical protein